MMAFMKHQQNANRDLCGALPEILYEDNHVLVAVKPPGMPSQEDNSHAPDMLTILRKMLSDQLDGNKKAFLSLVHRLDRPASGLMVFARSSKAASRLAEAFRSCNVGKEYLARVRGMPGEKGLFCDFLSRKKDEKGRIAVFSEDDSEDKMRVRAELSWRCLAEDQKKNEALLLIQLVTGRKHQIRAQFAARGFPLLGDRRYGISDVRDLGVPTLALHACRLLFIHPVKKTGMVFTSSPAINPSFTEEDVMHFESMLDKDTSIYL